MLYLSLNCVVLHCKLMSCKVFSIVSESEFENPLEGMNPILFLRTSSKTGKIALRKLHPIAKYVSRYPIVYRYNLISSGTICKGEIVSLSHH